LNEGAGGGIRGTWEVRKKWRGTDGEEKNNAYHIREIRIKSWGPKRVSGERWGRGKQKKTKKKAHWGGKWMSVKGLDGIWFL